MCTWDYHSVATQSHNIIGLPLVDWYHHSAHYVEYYNYVDDINEQASQTFHLLYLILWVIL